MYQIHCTRKLLDRVKPDSTQLATQLPTTRLGNWYATALFWRPQVAFFLNERTLLPVFMPLAPATTLPERFPLYLAQVLLAHGVPQAFVQAELEDMREVSCAKTANRKVLGCMNAFEHQAQVMRACYEIELLPMSVKLAHTPCFASSSKDVMWPDAALREIVERCPDGSRLDLL